MLGAEALLGVAAGHHKELRLLRREFVRNRRGFPSYLLMRDFAMKTTIGSRKFFESRGAVDSNLILISRVILTNRLHILLLVSTVSCYSIVVLGLFALGAHINRCIARVLKAVELLPSGD